MRPQVRPWILNVFCALGAFTASAAPAAPELLLDGVSGGNSTTTVAPYFLQTEPKVCFAEKSFLWEWDGVGSRARFSNEEDGYSRPLGAWETGGFQYVLEYSSQGGRLWRRASDQDEWENVRQFRNANEFYGSFGDSGYFSADAAIWRARGETVTPIPAAGWASSEPQHGFLAAGEHLFWARYEASSRYRLISYHTATGELTDLGLLLGTLAAVQVHQGLLYFGGTDGEHGRELWATDGTTSGTVLMKDVRPGPASSSPGLIRSGPDGIYFVANGRELWYSDGTEAGTRFLWDTRPVLAESAALMALSVPKPGAVIYNTMEPLSGHYLWLRDSAAGSSRTLLFDIPRYDGTPFSQLFRLGEQVFFPHTSEAAGREPWVTDGTRAGTRQVADLTPGTSGNTILGFRAAGSTLLLSTQTNLWQSKAPFTSATSILPRPYSGLGTAGVPSSEIASASLGSILIHEGRNSSGKAVLWRTDEQNRRTEPVTMAGGVTPTDVRQIVPGSRGFLATVSPDAFRSVALHWLDSNSSTTVALSTPLPLSTRALPIYSGGRFYLGTNLIGNVSPGLLVISEDTGELTTISTTFDQRPLGYVRGFAPFQGGALFVADSGRMAAYFTDGTPGGTRRLVETHYCSYSDYCDHLKIPVVSTASSGYFVSPTPWGPRLWVTDGTPEGTRPVQPTSALTPLPTPTPLPPTASYTIWYKDATESSDKSTTGTITPTPVPYIEAGPEDLIPFGERLLYTALVGNATGRALLVTDGSEASTEVLWNQAPNEYSPPGAPVILGQLALFPATTLEDGRELWVTDGTPSGTRLLLDLVPGPASSGPINLLSAGDRAYFSAWTPAAGRELWRTDGTPAGTIRVSNIAPDALNSNPVPLSTIGPKVFFAATDQGSFGNEVWRFTP